MFSSTKGIFDFEHMVVEAGNVAAAMDSIRASRSGIVPVVLGGLGDVKQVAELIRDNGLPDEVLGKGLALDVDRWMRDKRAADPEGYEADGGAGEASPAGPMMYITAGLNREAEIVIGLVPADPPWKVAAQIRFGGWNECPGPEEQVAFFKRWYERYGAVATTIVDDVVEFQVSRPPRGRDAALSLANEHFLYCPDSVHQGAGNLNTLAASLEGSHHWFFWWD